VPLVGLTPPKGRWLAVQTTVPAKTGRPPIHPDVFTQQHGDSGEIVDLVFGDPVAVEIEDVVDRLLVLGEPAGDLAALRVVALSRLYQTVDGKALHPVGGVVGSAIGGAGAAVEGDLAGYSPKSHSPGS